MWALYLKILALNVGLSNFVVLVVGFTRGHVLTAGDFFFPATIQFLLVSIIFIVLDLIRIHDEKSAVLAEPPGSHPTPRPALQPVAVKPTHRDFGGSTRNSTQGLETWNS